MNALAKHALLATCIVTLAAAGCTRNHPRPIAMQTGQLESHDNGTSNSGTNIDPEEIGAEGRTTGVKTVYFDYNSYALRADALTTLKDNATIFTRNVQRHTVQIEGHCDERGTQEYNLALGERRARATYEYLVMLGVNPSQLEMISFGKERPAVEGTGPAVWAKNRRDDFRVIAK